MSTRTRSLAASLLVAVLMAASGAHALLINPGNSGLDQAQACDSTFCLTPIYDDLTASGLTTGSLDITSGTLTFDITVANANLASTLGDGGVTSLDLSDFNYTGSVPVDLDGAGNYTVGFGQVASVSGTVTPIGAGTASAVSGGSVLVTGVCSGTPGVSLNCGLIFGPMMDFSANVNGNDRFFRHTVDTFASVVPEPHSGLLMFLGLMGLSSVRRSGGRVVPTRG